MTALTAHSNFSISSENAATLSKPLAIVGLPGSGKTTVGTQLAQSLGLDFIDSDVVLKDHIGCSIRDYFERYGEAQFRDLEEEIINRLAQNAKGVVSTGGGSVLRPNNRVALLQNFTVIYLSSTPQELFERLRHDTQRPLLQVSDPIMKLQELHSARTPLYESVAHISLQTGNLTIEEIVAQLTLFLRSLKL